VRKNANTTFDETAGKALGKALAYILVAPPIGGLLYALYSAVPNEFAFVLHLMKAAKAIFW
jgi:ethanolamine utilization microcompartment shell protein EutL